MASNLPRNMAEMGIQNQVISFSTPPPLNNSSDRPNFESTCNHCHKSATIRCAGCKDAPTFGEESSCIVYCNSICQKADYGQHKLVCRSFRSRKALYRAGELLQESFYLFREAVFEKRITKIEERNGKVSFYEPVYRGSLKSRIDCLEPFPSALCKSEEIKKGILVFLACSDAIGWMYDMSKYLLEGIASDVREECFMIRNAKLKFAAIDGNGWEDPRPFPHSVWKITLKPRGEQYILDLTGAQYGFQETVIPFFDFTVDRVREIVRDARQFPTTYGAGVGAYVSAGLNPAVLDLEKKLNLAIKDILQLPADQFQKSKDVLLDLVKTRLKDSIATLASEEQVQIRVGGGLVAPWGKKA